MQDFGLDIASLEMEQLGQEEGPGFPTAYSDYLKVSESLSRGISGGLPALPLSDTGRAAVDTVMPALISSAESAARVAIDISNARSKGWRLRLDPDLSPFGHVLSGSEPVRGEAVLRLLAPPRRKPLRPAARLRQRFAPLAVSLEMRMRSGRGRIDVHNHCDLLQSFLERTTAPHIELRPHAWPRSAPAAAAELADAAEAVVQVLGAALSALDCDDAISRRAVELVRHLSQGYLQRALALAKTVSSLRWLDNSGDILAGGTPKDIGRLLNWRYRTQGRQVWRFSHGGDRAFYHDPTWALGEFPHVTRYHVHGKGEAQRMTERFAQGKGIARAGGIPEFASHGSPRHQRWVEQGAKRTSMRDGDRGRIVVMGPAVLGDTLMAPLNFKPPDVILADTRAHFMRLLREAGYEVLFKPHPKGLMAERHLHAGTGAGLVTGTFDPVCMEADCFVFDFAGSAFFDALAGDKGIVLIDSGVRPWDSNGQRDLEMRVRIVRAGFDEHNRSRVDPAEFLDAVEEASAKHGCPPSFAEDYFYA